MDFKTLRESVLQSPGIWQYSLINARGLRKYCEDRGIYGFRETYIEQLFTAGLIRADRITTNEFIEISGIDLILQGDHEYTFSDNRILTHPENGYGGILKDQIPFCAIESVYFHPFRIYQLSKIAQQFTHHLSNVQFLLYPQGSHKIVDIEINGMSKWGDSEKSTESLKEFDRCVNLAVLFEPIGSPIVFGKSTYSADGDRENYLNRRENHLSLIKEFLQPLKKDNVTEIIKRLCICAGQIDDNLDLNRLIRMMSAEARKNVKYGIGAATCFLIMAEIIRRTYEKIYSVRLPEEDELGCHFRVKDVKISRFGTDRLSDANRITQAHIVETLGLGYTVKTRCYVEGETELGLLKHAVGDQNGIEFINLSGRFAEKGDKNLSFIDSLKRDMEARIFSVIILDGDQERYIRMLKRSAERDEFFGSYFISHPDIEFGNFSHSEIVKTISTLVDSIANSYVQVNVSQIAMAVNASNTGKELMRNLSDIGIADIVKGEVWGEALIRNTLGSENINRPIFEAITLLENSRRADYKYSIENNKIDPETGRLIPRF